MKNFLEFGVKKFGEKKIYETLSGNLYDTYMLGRYFKDIYNLDKLIKNKIKFNKNLLHDTKDLKFNLINFFLLLKNKNFFFMNLALLYLRKFFILSFLIIFFQKN